jgi:hypothetical protein
MMPVTGTLIVGAGPAGMGVLLAARGAGQLQALLDAGLKVMDDSPRLGAGELGRYAIRSDSFADSFLASAAIDAQPPLAGLQRDGAGAQLASQRGGPVPLKTAAEYMVEVSEHLRRWLAQHHYDPFLRGARAVKARRQSNGDWLTEYRDAAGDTHAIQSRNLVLATGAAQSLPQLEQASVAGVPLWPEFSNKVVLSGELLDQDGGTLLARRLAGIAAPKVVVIGGSHSAVSSALVCLQHWDAHKRQDGQVSVLHRRPIRITYQSPAVAIEEGYRDFGEEDICPRSGRVFPLAGMRSDSRQLLRRCWNLGDAEPEPRLRLLQLTAAHQTEAQALLRQADLIVAALGYRPRALPLFEVDGAPIPLLAHGRGQPMVDAGSRVLDSAGRPIESLYALGLSAGFPMAGVHGEPSFQGESNGLSLWHGEIGASIVAQILAPLTQPDEELSA